MAEEQKTTTPPDDSKTTTLTVGEITSLIIEKIKDQLPGKGSDPKSTGDSQPGTGSKLTDVTAQVQAELEKLRKREEAQRKDNDIQTRLTALEKPKPEKTPVERSLVHRFMGWGENE